MLMGTLRWERENEARRSQALRHTDALLRQQRAELALAGTKAQLETLARAQAVQEAELLQIRAAAMAELDARAGEDRELLKRRRADEGAVAAPGLSVAGDAP